MKHYSFQLSRRGIKPGYIVPLRLRWVVTLSILSVIPQMLAIFFIYIACIAWTVASWSEDLPSNDYLDLACLVTLFCVVTFGVLTVSNSLLRLAFQSVGLLTAEEAREYPLDSFKNHLVHGFPPWPDSWQVPETEFAETDSTGSS